MTRARTTKPTAPKVASKVTLDAAPEVTLKVIDPKAPVDIELEVTEAEPEPAVKKSAEEIHAEVQSKLNNKNVDNNIFVPASPAAVEKAAQIIAQEKGFEMNRGNSIGARLMARAQKKVL
jgi:uncharacterized Zn finger protein (UPF0148 family)